MTQPTVDAYLTELPPELSDVQKAFIRDAVSSKAHELDAFGRMSDEWVAVRVRMLMRSDPWHEPICSAGRDRIIRLVLKYEALLDRFEKACGRITELESAAETLRDAGELALTRNALSNLYMAVMRFGPIDRGIQFAMGEAGQLLGGPHPQVKSATPPAADDTGAKS